MEATDQVQLFFDCDGIPDGTWVVTSGTYDEKLNASFVLDLNLATNDMDAEPIQLLGKSCRFTLERGLSSRHVTGIVSRVREGSTHNQEVTTAIVIVPALEILRQRTNTRMFQNKTAPEILCAVLQEGLSSFNRTVQARLARTYPICEYRTQYRESDLAFCERLMEEEGIVYRLEFDETEPETMVLTDDVVHYDEVHCSQEGLPSSVIPYSEVENQVGGHEYIGSFQVLSQLRSTSVVVRHFDWTHPSMVFTADSSSFEPSPKDDAPSGGRIGPDREVYLHDDQPAVFYEYDGVAYAENDIDAQVRLRREAQTCDARVAEARTTVTGMTAGRTFELLGHPVNDLDGRYLVLAVSHTFEGRGGDYGNQLHCIPADCPYRPRRATVKPRASSIQTAIVVGPAGEEIHTDEHGRVKVQFHWDREGRNDENSSCWIRVMQPWGGSGWGFVFIPRIGMEVMVAFTNSDPDQPVVVGSLYNGEHPPPYSLPAEKTKSTIKTCSSPGGGGFNELRFEDKAGLEEVFVHAQKDFNEVVEHDHNTVVHNDQSNSVDGNQREMVHVDQSLTVDRHRDKTVIGDETTSVMGNRTEDVTGDETITLRSNRTVSVASHDTLTVKKGRSMTILAELNEHVVGVHERNVEAMEGITVGLSKTEDVGTTLDVKAGESISFVTGKSSITMEEDGTITIQGEKVILKGRQVVGAKGGKGSLTLDKGQAKVKGPKVEVRGKGLVHLVASKITEN